MRQAGGVAPIPLRRNLIERPIMIDHSALQFTHLLLWTIHFTTGVTHVAPVVSVYKPSAQACKWVPLKREETKKNCVNKRSEKSC